MKIRAIETLRADRFMYVKVMTDEDITGIGELHPASGTGGTPFLPLAGVQYCAEYLLGKTRCRLSATGSIYSAAVSFGVGRM